MSSLLLRAEAAVLDGELVEEAGVVVEDGVVTAAGRLAAIQRETAAEREIQGTLLPGPIDLQVNGAGGRGVEEATPEALDAVALAVLEGGATAFLPTLITAPFEALLRRAAAVAAWIAGEPGRGAVPLGLHVEGPFLEVPGAHDPRYLVDPTPERIDALLEACAGRLSLVTLAPGRPGAVEATRRLTDAGVRVAIGHAEDAGALPACVDAGATLVTHLFNAMGQMHHRRPGIAGMVLDEPRLACSLILDGVHLHPVMVRNAWRCLGPERTVLVTDSVSAAGMPDGEYRLGSETVRLERGVVRDGNGRLAGSALRMADAAARFLQDVSDAGPVELARVSASNPAELLGDARRGSIAPGRRAELVVLGEGGSLTAVGL